MLNINPAVSRAFVKRRPKIIAGTFLGEEDGRRCVRERKRWSVGRE
jgi:hypothetical protein